MTAFDVNVHLGSWPFSFLPRFNARQLDQHLAAHGIRRALVAPLDAVLAPDPLPASRALVAALRGSRSLTPVPAVNPALAHWREQLDFVREAGLTAVRLYPNYHHYRLEAPRLAPFFAEVQARGLRLIVTTRLEDERHRYFALNIKGVPLKSLAAFLRKYPRLHPLIAGLYLPELRELKKLARNFSADTAFMEWIYSGESLAAEFPHDRLMFGSHTPFFVTAASLAKLESAKLPPSVRTAYLQKNATEFFALRR